MYMKNIFNKINNSLSKIYYHFSNKTYFLLLMFNFALFLFLYKDNVFYLNKNLWQTKELLINYSYGFVRRGLLGSLTHLIYNNTVLNFATAAKIVQSIGLLLFTLAILLFFASLLKIENEKSFCFIVLLFISLHFWGFQLKQFGLFDTYMIAITLLIVYLITVDKALFLVPILAAICTLIHEGYPAMFFAVIISLLIYKFSYAKNRKMQHVYIVIFLSTCLAVGFLFVYFYFINPRIKTTDTESIMSYFKELLGITDTSEIKYMWFDGTIEPNSVLTQGLMWINGKPTPVFFKLFTIFLLNTVICTPLIYMTVKYWHDTVKAEQSKHRRMLLLFSALTIFLIVPLIIIHCDQGRWFYDIIFFEIVMIGSMFKLNYNNERKILSEITKPTITKLLLLVFYFIFYFNHYVTQLGVISKYFLPIFNS